MIEFSVIVSLQKTSNSGANLVGYESKFLPLSMLIHFILLIFVFLEILSIFGIELQIG